MGLRTALGLKKPKHRPEIADGTPKQAVSLAPASRPRYLPSNTLLEDHVHLDKCELFHGGEYRIGYRTYINPYTLIRPWTDIGRYCSIGRRCSLAPGEHPLHQLSTHPFARELSNAPLPPGEQVPPEHLIIGNDVWIGDGAVVMRGVTVGDGAVVAANAVVTKDVPPYAVVGGVPARIIKFRHSPEIIEDLLSIRWWDYEESFISGFPSRDIKNIIEIMKSRQASSDFKKLPLHHKRTHIASTSVDGSYSYTS